MTFTFKKATRQQSKLRLALIGVSGSGKTWTALTFAKRLGKRIAVIDSERGSASLYAGDAADFDVLELESYAPRTYVQAIKAAEQAGYDVIVVDSLSHAWAGKDGALEMVDKAAKRTQASNTFAAWRDVTPEHNALVEAMLACKAHLIVTMRSKTEYVLQEDNRGKKVPKKIGMAPVQRDGLEYEFTLVAEMDLDHNFMVSKSRCKPLDGAVIIRPDESVAETLLSWLNEGEVAQEKPAQQARPFAAPNTQTRTQTTQESSSPSTTHSTTTSAIDEYGLTAPASPCPIVSAQAKEYPGKSWMQVPEWMVCNWLEKNHAKMNEAQQEWAMYISARRQARKAKEAREAEALAAESAGETGVWVADEGASAQGE